MFRYIQDEDREYVLCFGDTHHDTVTLSYKYMQQPTVVTRDENKENNLADKVADKLFFLPDK